MSRTSARKHTFVLMYQMEFCNADELESRVDYYLADQEIDEQNKDYIHQIFWSIVKNCDTLDKMINQHAKGWTVERMSKVDVAIMRLAAYELLYMEDIPSNVSFNEAVELAKRFSSDDAPAFINGVLGGIERSKAG